MHDNYKPLELPPDVTLAPCPVCGADASLWQFTEAPDVPPVKRLVCCTRGERFGPQDGMVNEGCLLYMPPEDFYRLRIAEAIKYWNEYATALLKIQRANRWARVGSKTGILRSADDADRK